MKIEQQLMTVIRAAAKLQPRPNRYELRRKNNKAAILDLIARKPALKRAWDALEKLRKECAKHEKVLNAHGLYINGNLERFNCEETFRKKGGKLPEEPREWTAEEVFIKLAGAKDQKAFDAILKSYGIEWKV